MVLIPAAVCRKLGVEEGRSDLLLHIDETPIRVSTRAQPLVRIRKEIAKHHKPGDDWVGELLAERRDEARRKTKASEDGLERVLPER